MTLTGSVPAPRVLRRARHIVTNYFIGPARNAKILEIWGYSDRLSYAPGDKVALHVNTTADRYDVEIGRDGARYKTMRSWTNLPGDHYETPLDCSITGCNWPTAMTFEIPQDWPSGGYLLTFRGHRGSQTVEEHHLIIVRGGEKKSSILVLCSTATWMAYNCWGGSNSYEGIAGKDGRQFSPILSTQRPWSRGFCKLPAGAPRALPETSQNPGDVVRYPYMEWAFSNGYSKKYASAGWASYERHFARWAETNGYAPDFASQHDLDADPTLLNGYSCVVIVGHDEYWSSKMRLALDNWIETGGNLARFAGNFLWQVRIEDQGRQQVCYKHKATDHDPVMSTPNQHLLTDAWESDLVRWPGASTVGANGLYGVYAGLGKCAGAGSSGFTVYQPDHWAFAGTHLGYGDELGSAARIFGYEVDGLDLCIKDGLPRATGDDGASMDIDILAVGLASNQETDHAIWGEDLYIGSAEVNWVAKTRYGKVSSETVAKAKRGNGVIVSWKRNKGEVFCAATCEWVMGLSRRDAQVEQVTRNVLDRFCD